MSQITTEEIHLSIQEAGDKIVLTQEIETKVIETGNIIKKEIVVSGADRLELDFTFEDVPDGSISFGFIPALKRVYNTVLIIQTAFDALTVTIGDDDAQARLMTIAENNPAIENIYSVENHVEYDALTELKIYLTGNPTIGAGTAIIYYS